MTDDSDTTSSGQHSSDPDLTDLPASAPRWSASETLARALGTAPSAPPATDGEDTVVERPH